MSNKIKCTCGHSWNKSSSNKKDMRICHICGKDNTMKNGGWLDAYDDKLQLGGNVYPANYVPQAQVGINTGDIASLPGVRKEIPVSKEQLAKNKKEIEVRNAKTIADRKARIKASELAHKKPISAKVLAEQNQATGDKFRLFPDDASNVFDDYFNPGVIIGDMASDLGSIPYNLQQGNYGQAAMSAASPLLTGALAGIGAKTAGQFVNNLVNPFAGISLKKLPQLLVDAKLLKKQKPTKSKTLIPQLPIPVEPSLTNASLAVPNSQSIFYNLDKTVSATPNISYDYSTVLPNKKSYEKWADLIHDELINDISVDELMDAHKKAIEHFKGATLTGSGGKEYGLFIRNLLQDKISKFTNPIIRDEQGNLLTRYSGMNVGTLTRKSPEVRKGLQESGYDVSKLNTGDWNIMDAYSKGYDNSINELLRRNSKHFSKTGQFYKDQADRLKETVLKNKSKNPLQVVRGVSDYDVELLDPITRQPLGITKKRSELGVGDIFKDESFMSTGLGERFFGTYDASELIDIPGGYKQSLAIPEASSYPQFPGEKEVILPPGLIRRVEEVTKDATANAGQYRFRTSILNPYAVTGAIAAGTAATQQKRNGGYIPIAENGLEASTDGFTDQGFNYNGAWGGTMEDGGDIPKAQNGLWNTNKTQWVDSIHNARRGDLDFVNRYFDPSAGSIPTPRDVEGWKPGQTSTHLMAYDPGTRRVYPEVVNVNGKLQYMPGDKGYNYADDTKQFIEFPTAQQATWYANNGYKKGTDVLKGKSSAPKKAMGGNIPGSVGFTYARTKGIPSNGPYAKKTLASAQNGKEMSFYQNGLDWTPRNISRDGSEIPQAQLGLHMLTPDYNQVGENIMEMLSVPQKALTKLVSGKYQTPSEAMGIKNKAGAIAADMVLDPTNLIGVGVASKITKGVKAAKSAKVPIALENTLLNEGINLERTATKAKRAPNPSMDKVDLGNDLVLVNNPSRVNNPESILGKQREIKSVSNPKTGEYISLKTWKDDAGDIKYYFSANMPSSKIKAGKAYLELEKHIPKGATIMEPSNSSLSLDSYINTIKQTKNPKFASNVEDYVSLNRHSVLNKLKNKGDADFGYYKSPELAKAGANEISELLKKYNLPKAKIAPVEGYSIRTDGNVTSAYEIKIPNISLKKLYALLGVTAGGTAIDQKKQGGEITKDDNGYWNPENWGKPVEIGSNNITMRGVNQPLIGISDEGDVQYMQPEQDYKFKGKKVTEYPIAEDGYTGSSVVDYLSTKGLSSTKSARKELAREFNVDDYDYSSGKNLELLEKLRNSDERLNKMKKDYTPISVERLEQMLGKKQDKKSPSPASSSPKKPINKAMLDLMMMQPSFNPNIEKPALNLADVTTVSSEEISPTQTSFGIDPSAWNTSGFNPRISRSQPSGAPLPQIDTNMIWNTSGASPRVFDQQEENSSLPNIDFNQAWNTSGTSPRNINTQQPFSTVPTPLWRSDAAPIPNTQGAPFSTVPNPLWGNNPQVNQPTNNLTNIGDHTDVNAMGIPNLGMDAINDAINYVKKGIKYGPSLAKRMASMLVGDDESTISKPLVFKKLPVSKNKEEISKEQIDESPFDPITTGNIRSDEHDTEHRGPGFYHTNEMIDLDKFKFGFHNREGQGSTTDKFNVTKTEGLVIPVFDKEYGEVDGTDAGGTRSIRKYKDSEIKDTKLYGGVDDKGKFYLDYGKNLKGKDLTMADFRYIDATGFAKDADGNFVLGNETSNNKIAKVPHLINTKGKEEHLNILVPKLGKDQHLKYGDITGGRMILTTPDMKHKFLASGSLQDLNDTLEEFKKRFKTESVRVVVLDNGTFSRGLRKTNKKIYKNDWKKYDKANDQGGAGFYYYKDGGEVKPTTGWLDKYN